VKKGEGLLRQPKRIRFQYIHQTATAKKTISKLCALLSVSKAGYYKWLKQSLNTVTGRNEFLLQFLIKRSNEEHCIPGYRKLWEAAIADGHDCSKGRVQRLLQSVGYR
ncbi:IS3 family transposase, partial [Pseudoalteromonas citrea]